LRTPMDTNELLGVAPPGTTYTKTAMRRPCLWFEKPHTNPAGSQKKRTPGWYWGSKQGHVSHGPFGTEDLAVRDWRKAGQPGGALVRV